jgi:DNA helicase II / ATP-dependent DNA helicase PcrA
MAMLTKPSPTDEQLDILNAATLTRDNLMLNALAGTGKTSTLELIERAMKPIKPILYLVFNKKNADEATDRMLSTTTVRTFNSLGHRIWAQSQSKNLRLNAKKSGDTLRELIKEAPPKAQGELWDSYHEVIAGVALAKALGYVPEGKYPNAKRLISQGQFHRMLEERPDDLTSDLIDAVLVRSIKASYDGLIDYNDQIYMPALFGGTFPRFPLVLVDEYQDLSPVNHALLERLVKNRLIGVGDPYQNIYGFRGAKAGGMSEATSHFKMQSLPLSISFRCPSAIVEHVHWRVPHFKWLNEGGEVHVPRQLHADTLSDGITIICRNNAPLFSVAFKLLGMGRSVYVAGSDVGPKLIALMKKLGSGEMTQAQTLSSIDDWLADKLEKESKNAPDLAECMRIFAKQANSLGTAIVYAEHLFKQSGSIRLLTGHKAKGLEFDDVLHLEPSLLSSSDQDKNLSYVISTRSKNKLTEIASADIRW